MPKDDSSSSHHPRDLVRPVDAAGAGAGSSNLSTKSKAKTACLNCRKRKLKCDAVRPICNTCTRSYNHAVQHTKPGDPRPPPPCCNYEDPPEPTAAAGSAGSSASASSSGGAVSALETRVRELEAMLSQAAAVSGLSGLAFARADDGSGGGGGGGGGMMDGVLLGDGAGHQQVNAQAGPSGTQWPFVGDVQDASRVAHHHQHRHNTYPGATAPLDFARGGYVPFPSVQSQAAHPPPPPPPPSSAAAAVGNSLPPASSFPPPPNRRPSSGPTAGWGPRATPAFAAASAAPIDTFPPQQPAPASASSSSGAFRSAYSNFAIPTTRPSPPPSSSSAPVEPPPEQVGASLSDYIQRNLRLPSHLNIDKANPSSTGPVPTQPAQQQQQAYGTHTLEPGNFHFQPGQHYARPSVVDTADPTSTAAQRSPPVSTSSSSTAVFYPESEKNLLLMASAWGGTATQQEPFRPSAVRETEESPPSGDELHDLLWPGYPPHLPPPAMLERCVETFFSKHPTAPHLFDKGRFLSRLAMPPTHALYPHPAVLHAICASAAFWLGDIYLVPASERAIYTDLSGRRKANRNALSIDRRPRWDGLGPPPAGLRSGIDGDFGEVHFSWTRLYIDDDMASPDCWHSLGLAAVIVGQYCHSSSRWIDGWTLMAVASRLCVPLMLHTKVKHQSGWNVKPTLMQPATDAADQRTRDNLWYYILSLDAHVSASSTWPGSIEETSTTVPIPGNFGATEPSSDARETAQTAISHDVFTRHPPGTTSFTLLVKSALLLRKVNTYIRLVDAAPPADPAQSAEFRSLDSLITTFRMSFPPELRNPMRGNSVDVDLFAAHCNSLVCCIQLHERFAEPEDDDNTSNGRILASARGLLGFVHLIQATPFDLTLLYPFTSYSFFSAARIQMRWLRVALEKGDSHLEAALRAEINVFRSALEAIGEKLPIGSRQARMLDQLMTDIATSPTENLGPTLVTHYLRGCVALKDDYSRLLSHGAAASAGADDPRIVEISPPASSSTPASSGPLVPPEPPTFHPSPWSQNLASVLDGELSTLGAPLESWAFDDDAMKELGYGAAVENRPSPLSYFFSPGTPSIFGP